MWTGGWNQQAICLDHSQVILKFFFLIFGDITLAQTTHFWEWGPQQILSVWYLVVSGLPMALPNTDNTPKPNDHVSARENWPTSAKWADRGLESVADFPFARKNKQTGTGVFLIWELSRLLWSWVECCGMWFLQLSKWGLPLSINKQNKTATCYFWQPNYERFTNE